MRKRVLMAVTAIMSIAVIVYALTRPRPGTLEWHKARYFAAWDRANEKDWRGRLVELLIRINVRPPDFLYVSKAERSTLNEEASLHRSELVRLGYFSERTIDLSNIWADDILVMFYTNPPAIGDKGLIYVDCYVPTKTNAMSVIAPTRSIRLWEDYFRKMDLPKENK